MNPYRLLRRYGSTLFMAASALLIVGGLAFGLLEVVVVLLIIAPFVGAWASWKLWKWHQFYGTRFLWGLFVASLAADISSIPVAIISARRLVLGPDAPAMLGTGEVLGLSLIVFEGVFIYLVLRWQDLDIDMERVRIGLEDESEGTNLAPEEENRSGRNHR